MKGVERGKNLSAPRKEVDSILDKPLFGDSGAGVKRTEEPANEASYFDVFLALNRRVIG
tara:strand:- start:3042 stop:3218 length:177 start_codon:yes stop_codon:yes gene_type:complete